MEIFDLNDSIETTQADCSSCRERGQKHENIIRVQKNSLCTQAKNGILHRKKNMPERKFVERCLERVKENSVEIEDIIRVFTKRGNVMNSSAVTSSVYKALKSNNLETWFLEQLEKPLEETRNQLEDIFEDCFMRMLKGLSDLTIFSNILDNMVNMVEIQ